MVVLDTHAFLWAYGDSRLLSSNASTSISEADVIGISAISIWEIAMLVNRGRLELEMPAHQWVRTAFTEDARLSELKLDSAIAFRAGQLEQRGLVGDPADQLIFASADFYSAQLVTKDKQLRAFAPEATVW